MKQNRRNILILFFSLAVVMLGFGIVIPILPFYVEKFGASGSSLGLLMASFAVMQFIFAPIWGGISDRYGRKPVLMLGVLGNALAHLLFGLSTQLWMLFAARAMAGILSAATMPAAMAYIGDSTSERERGSGMGILRAAVGVGIIVGPGLGGWLSSISLSFPFYLAAILSALAVLPIFLLLPESLPLEKRTLCEAGVCSTQFSVLCQALCGPIGCLLLLSFLLSFGLTSFEGIFGLYAFKLYGYGPERIGTIIVMIGVISATMQSVLTGPLSRRWGEAYIIKVSLIVCAVGFVLMLQARSFYEVLLTVGFFIIGSSLLRPTVSSLISKRTTITQGKALGLNNSFMSLGRIFGPACAGFLLDIKISYPYLSCAAIMLIGFLASIIWLEREPLSLNRTHIEPVINLTANTFLEKSKI
jgi:DHA1 family multidrug resistance protein-like MFS transporter